MQKVKFLIFYKITFFGILFLDIFYFGYYFGYCVMNIIKS